MDKPTALKEIEHLKKDLADMRKEMIAQYKRNKELSDNNEQLRSNIIVLNNQLSNAQKVIKGK